MTRRSIFCRATLVPHIAAAAIVCTTQFATYAQEAQPAAQAKVAREKATAERVANTTVPATTERGKDDVKAPNPADLKKRAGEQVAGTPRGKSILFGMHVQEANNGRVKVVEVGAATPAYDAGIREGDELVSFKDFKADNYRKWIDGISKVASSSPDGAMLPVVVLRQGKQVALEVRVPEGRNAPLQLPIGPPPAGPQGPQAPQGTAAGEGGSDSQVSNTNAFGAFFQGDASHGTEKAMAQLMRVGHKPQAPSDPGPKLDVGAKGDVGANWTAEPVPPKKDPRIGLAGFRNDANGMLVMVDVGALEPGNYVVGIGDPSVMGQQPNVGNAPAAGAQPQQDQSAAVGPGAAATSATIPPTNGLARPVSTPPSGEINPSTTTPTGQSSANIGLAAQPNQAATTNVGTNAGTMVREIGTLTVDQSGTGRMQHTVEGIQVRDVVGQAIVLYPQLAGNPKTLPPNLDPTVDPAASEPPSVPNGAPVTNRAPVGDGQPSGFEKPAAPAAGGAVDGAQPPVAAGVIHLLSDHGPAPVDNAAGDAEAFGPATPQPASNAPAAPAKAIR